jgi:hypothetical protein
MNDLKKISFVSVLLFALPLIAAATTGTLNDEINIIIFYLNRVLVLIMALSVVFFVWYVVQYFIKSGEAEKRKEAGQYVMYSLIGFFVILSFWGLVNILQNTFGLRNSDNQSSWYDFMNIFPSGSGGSSPSNTSPGPNGVTGFNPPASH